MRIQKIQIENLRAIKCATLDVDSYTALVGQNGAGKSTFLFALNIFFRNIFGGQAPLSIDDFYGKETRDDIKITVTFSDLSGEATDTLKHYVRNDELVVTATASYSSAAQSVEVRQYGERLGIKEFAEYFAAEKASEAVKSLKERYAKLCLDFPGLDIEASTKAAMSAALSTYESENPHKRTLIRSEDQFYGWGKGKDRLEKYIQWVYIPATKDASEESMDTKNSAFRILLDRTIRDKVNIEPRLAHIRDEALLQYTDAMNATEEVFDEVSASLSQSLSEFAHADASMKIEWLPDYAKSVVVNMPTAHVQAAEGEFESDLSRFGHGFQRSYLLALLSELGKNSGQASESRPTLVIGCEEPELYQHPPQARHLANILHRLSGGDTQILLTTHSPHFIQGNTFEEVRLVRKDVEKGTCVHATSYNAIHENYSWLESKKSFPLEAVGAKLHQLLQPNISEMFFCNRPVLVEGLEDVAFITTYLEKLGLLDTYHSKGCHLVPCHGKSEIIWPLLVLESLGTDFFVMFDCDGDEDDASRRKKHEIDNASIFQTVGLTDLENAPFVSTPRIEEKIAAWPNNIGDTVRSEIDAVAWQNASDATRQSLGFPPDFKKNGLHIAMVLQALWMNGHQSQSLIDACEAIVAHC